MQRASCACQQSTSEENSTLDAHPTTGCATLSYMKDSTHTYRPLHHLNMNMTWLLGSKPQSKCGEA